MKFEECQNSMANIEELSRLMDYAPSYVRLVMNGKRRPGKKFLKTLEKIPLEAVMKKYIRRKPLKSALKTSSLKEP